MPEREAPEEERRERKGEERDKGGEREVSEQGADESHQDAAEAVTRLHFPHVAAVRLDFKEQRLRVHADIPDRDREPETRGHDIKRHGVRGETGKRDDQAEGDRGHLKKAPRCEALNQSAAEDEAGDGSDTEREKRNPHLGVSDSGFRLGCRKPGREKGVVDAHHQKIEKAAERIRPELQFC